MDLMGLVPSVDSELKKKTPVISHECRQKQQEDEVNKYIRGTDLISRINRWLTRQRVLSTKHYFAQACLKSTTAIRYEISKHLQSFPYMVHPFSPFKNFWDIVMTFFTFMALMMTPYLSAFFFENQTGSLPYMMLIDSVLLFDVGLHFFTGYYDEGIKTVTLDPRIVFMKYLKGFFFFDVLSAAPIEIFDFMSHAGREHPTWYCSAFNFVKIFRIRNLVNYINQFHKSYHMSYHKVKMMKLTIIIIISMHWSACLVYYVPLVESKFNYIVEEESKDPNDLDFVGAKSWLQSEVMQKRKTRLRKYILCLNRATISLVTSSHYLDVSTTEDKIMNFVLAIYGKIGCIYLLSQFLQLMTTLQSSNKERLRLLQQLQEYMMYKELPRVTQKRLIVYCNYWYKKNFSRDKHILAQVSEPLREELILHNYTKLLETVDLFKYLPQSAIVQLVNYIQPEIYLANDMIVKAGAHGDSLYFVGSGTVAVYTALGKEVCHLEDGSYFGEIALIIDSEQRVASVVAIETCEILVVPREGFQQVIAPYPKLLSRLQKVALERFEKTLLLDEIYRLEDQHPQYINISNIRGKVSRE